MTEERVGWSEFTSGVCVDVCGLVKGMNCKTHTPTHRTLSYLLLGPCPAAFESLLFAAATIPSLRLACR